MGFSLLCYPPFWVIKHDAVVRRSLTVGKVLGICQSGCRSLCTCLCKLPPPPPQGNIGQEWGFLRLLTLYPARGGGRLIHFFALPSQGGGDLVHFGVCFALCMWGGGLVFTPLPCPSKKEGHFNNPVVKKPKLSSNCGDTDCRRLHCWPSLSCDGEFIFAVELQSSNCDPFVCQPVQMSVKVH